MLYVYYSAHLQTIALLMKLLFFYPKGENHYKSNMNTKLKSFIVWILKNEWIAWSSKILYFEFQFILKIVLELF